MCPVSCKLQNLSIKLLSGSVSELLLLNPCVFPPQHSAIPSVSFEQPTLLVHLLCQRKLCRSDVCFFMFCDISNGALTFNLHYREICACCHLSFVQWEELFKKWEKRKYLTSCMYFSKQQTPNLCLISTIVGLNSLALGLAVFITECSAELDLKAV